MATTKPGGMTVPGMTFGSSWAGVNGGVCGKLWPFGSFHGPPIR